MHELKSKGIKDETREEKHGGLGVEERRLPGSVIQDYKRFIVLSSTQLSGPGTRVTGPDLYCCDELGSDLTRLG